MKNILRLILFIALVFIGSLVLHSDFNTEKSDNKAIAVVKK